MEFYGKLKAQSWSVSTVVNIPHGFVYNGFAVSLLKSRFILFFLLYFQLKMATKYLASSPAPDELLPPKMSQVRSKRDWL